MIGFDLALPQSPVEGLQHQRGLHGGAHGPVDHAAAVKVDPDRQVPPARCGADVGDVAGPGAFGGCWAELLLQQVLRNISGYAAAIAVWFEPSAGLYLEYGFAHEPGNASRVHQELRDAELLMDA